MRHQKTQYGYVLVFDRGESVIESFTAFLEDANIAHGTFSGIGATEHTTIGYYDFSKKEYVWNTFAEPHEVVALSGNTSMVDGKPFVHAHIALGNHTMQVVGGHLKEATVAVTLEIALIRGDVSISRTYSDTIGLKLLDL